MEIVDTAAFAEWLSLDARLRRVIAAKDREQAAAEPPGPPPPPPVPADPAA